MAILSDEFIQTIHNANLSSWLTKNDNHPEGMIAANIFRNMDLARIDEFITTLIMLSIDVGIPKNVEAALIFYIEALRLRLTATEFASMQGKVSSGMTPEIAAKLPPALLLALA